MSKLRVALVSTDVHARSVLGGYLTGLGFEVQECEELALASSFGALVVIVKDEVGPDALAAQVRSWLRLAKTQRIVVVTSRPAALRELAAAHSGRLYVLAAPAFGWDVVDALRATEHGPRPRGA